MKIRIKRNCTFPRMYGVIKYEPGDIVHNARRVDNSWLGHGFEVEDMAFTAEDAEEIPEPPEGYRMVKSNHGFGDFAYIDKGHNRVEGFRTYEDAVKGAHDAHAVDTAHKRAVAAAKAYDKAADVPVAITKVSSTGFLCVLKNEEWVPVCAMEFRQWRAWKEVVR